MIIRLILTLSALTAAPAVYALDESLFENEESGGREYRQAPGTEWKELDAGLPEFPREENLIQLDMYDYNFPFAVYIDEKSVSLAKDRIVRYTVVVRSKNGADNISYEGIQCHQRKVKRYGYGSGGRMQAANNAEWRFIRKNRQDSYRNLLANDIFCPTPMGNPEREIIIKLKDNSVSSRNFSMDDE